MQKGNPCLQWIFHESFRPSERAWRGIFPVVARPCDSA